ncbi:MAG: glycosyltransferase family 2 protein [Planctomycetota bacterium]
MSILVISFNTRVETLACLASVREHVDAEAVGGYEVLVVDNASSDGSADAIAEAYPDVRLIRSETNLGFAAANNLAAEDACGDMLLLLNSDTELLGDAVTQAVRYHDTTDGVGIVGGRTFFADGRLNPNSCHGRPTPWSMLCMAAGFSVLARRRAAALIAGALHPEGLGAWQRDTAREVDAITGCFLLMARDLWNELGGFDKRFFMYGEDTDLCLRAKQLGARSAVCPDARLIHHGGRSDRVRADKMIKLFRAKHQLARRHWGKLTQPLAPLALNGWAFSRYAAHRTLAAVRPNSRASADQWREVWRRRREYAV